ncbi:MAG TPA: hypothetical protein VLG91_18370, partial [Streptomyces sp.]|nr:hypothetical protein [Streptomyces sp.]
LGPRGAHVHSGGLRSLHAIRAEAEAEQELLQRAQGDEAALMVVARSPKQFCWVMSGWARPRVLLCGSRCFMRPGRV